MLDRAHQPMLDSTQVSPPFNSPHSTKGQAAGVRRVAVKPARPREKGSSPARPVHLLGRTKQTAPWKNDTWQHQQQQDYEGCINENDNNRNARRKGGDNQSQVEINSKAASMDIAKAGRRGRERDGEGDETSRVGGLEADAKQGFGSVSASTGVVTIETILENCGRSLIESSAVSAPMDFLTSEAEYRKVWQVCTTVVGICGYSWSSH